MDLSKKRCGECGKKAYARKTLFGPWQKQWKDYPFIFLIEKLELWVCGHCHSHAVTPGDTEKIDRAVEESVREQTRQYLTIIKSKTDLSFEEIAVRLGKSPSYISSLLNKKKTPAFGLWNQLKSAAIDPISEMNRLNPELDIIKENLLLRA